MGVGEGPEEEVGKCRGEGRSGGGEEEGEGGDGVEEGEEGVAGGLEEEGQGGDVVGCVSVSGVVGTGGGNVPSKLPNQ